ncbi:hypothetical protein [uncultured Deinococcus sp.]|uniref:hypothetical protein n=1 Tax=uncultured Deinococcus sp. TaxID=158789 RepID=UPI002586224F|nr:hypothetical protein [uncultured Deinococcus sp.]
MSSPYLLTAPAPWTLRGRGWLALYRLRPARVGALLLVRYAASPVGPYDELMWVEAPIATPAGGRPSIRRIVVSTAASVTWGRRNWAIPKAQASFDWSVLGQVRVTDADGEPYAHLAFRRAGPDLPVNAAWLPRAWRTVAQPALDGRPDWLLTTIGGTAQASAARVTVLHTDRLRPELSRQRPLLSLGFTEIGLHFPEPDLWPTSGERLNRQHQI